MRILSVFFTILLLSANFAYADDFSCKSVPDEYFEEYFLEGYGKLSGIELHSTKYNEYRDQQFDEAIKSYSSTGYIDLNYGLRTGRMSTYLSRRANILCLALRNLKPYTKTSFRLANLPKNILKQYLASEGQVITEKAFLSSSSARLGARAYIFMTGDVPNTQFIIKSKTGRQIKDHALLKFEFEVLYPAGGKFLVTKIKTTDKEDGLNKIWMTEVDE